MSADDLTEVPTSLSFDVAVDRISSALMRADLTIFARIDHAAAARDVGLTMPPTIVLVYGNAKGGTPIMQAVPAAALDLPLRVLIREDTGGQAVVSFHPVRKMLTGVGVPDSLASRIEPAQHVILEAAKSRVMPPSRRRDFHEDVIITVASRGFGALIAVCAPAKAMPPRHGTQPQ